MTNIFKKKKENTSDDLISLSHTKWNCKYHIVFTPRYRRKIFYGEKRREIGKILRELCDWNEVKIIEAEVRQITFICLWQYHQNYQYQNLWEY